MRVIFLQDVPNVARAGEIKEVADGYGKNFLIPRKLALLANSESVTTVGAQLKKQARSQIRTEAGLIELANQLDAKEIILEARTGAQERLYGSITTADIAEELERITGFAVDKRKIELDEPIRQIGNYEVTIRLAKDIAAEVMVTVSEKTD